MPTVATIWKFEKVRFHTSTQQEKWTSNPPRNNQQQGNSKAAGKTTESSAFCVFAPRQALSRTQSSPPCLLFKCSTLWVFAFELFWCWSFSYQLPFCFILPPLSSSISFVVLLLFRPLVSSSSSAQYFFGSILLRLNMYIIFFHYDLLLVFKRIWRRWGATSLQFLHLTMRGPGAASCCCLLEWWDFFSSSRCHFSQDFQCHCFYLFILFY